MLALAYWQIAFRWLVLPELIMSDSVAAPADCEAPPARLRHMKDGRTFAFDASANAWRLVSEAASESGEPEVQLALPWSQFHAAFDGDFKIAGTPLNLGGDGSRRHQDQQQHGDTGSSIWDGAIALAKVLESNPWLVQGREVLELGAGRGLAGLSAALLGAKRTILTDLPYCLEALEEASNLTRPGGGYPGPVEIAALDWANPTHFLDSRPDFHFEVILAADVVWLIELVELLASALRALAVRRPAAEVLVVHQTRASSVEVAFLQAMDDQRFELVWELRGGSAEPVPALGVAWDKDFIPDSRINLWCFRLRE
ncbi:unnamed protein product, partial [Polarella glacialis]